MLFGLKISGATYQRLVNKIFKEQIKKNMGMYVDDMLIKSRVMEYHITDLEETFAILRCFYMKLNLDKCTFGVHLASSSFSWCCNMGLRPTLRRFEHFRR